MEVSGMKISGTDSNFLNVRTNNPPTNQTSGSALSRKNDTPIQVTISEVGKLHYMNSIQKESSESESYASMVEKREKLLEANLSSDLDYDFQLGNEVAKYKEEGVHSTVAERADNLLKSYASLYDKIVQGYADGTREIHVHNTGSSKGYRILTQEEELNSLNSSFGKYADGLAAQAEEEPKINKIVDNYIKQLGKIGVKSNLAQNHQDNVILKKKDEVIPQNINEKLVNASVQFINMYSLFDKNTVDISNILQNFKF